MIKKTEDLKFIIAYYLPDPHKSLLLLRNVPVSTKVEMFFSKRYFEKFVGRRYMICECKVIESVENEQDYLCQIIVDGLLTAFEVEVILRTFPLVEGEVSPGIYNFNEGECEYYEIKNVFDLSDYFALEPMFDYENEKIVCSLDGITIKTKDGEEICFCGKHPLTFYDISCPLCGQPVVTYKTDGFKCLPIYLSCPHFVGEAVWGAGGYEAEPLNNFRINHKFIDKNLHFETVIGWQKPILYAPPHDPKNSYWDGSGNKGEYATHFLFMKVKSEFWIKSSVSQNAAKNLNGC